MENPDLKRLPDPNTCELNTYYLPDRYGSGMYKGTETIYYKHWFRDEKGNVTAHWSKKAILPENATLDDL